MKVEIELTAEDAAMLRAIKHYTSHMGIFPKRRQIVRNRDATLAEEKLRQKTFDRLKLLGLVRHELKGQCSLTEAAHALPL